jgi:hypothetical protein
MESGCVVVVIHLRARATRALRTNQETKLRFAHRGLEIQGRKARCAFGNTGQQRRFERNHQIESALTAL